MRILLYIIIAALLFTACEKEEFVFEQENNIPVTVNLNIRQKPATNTRAASAMGPEKENLIYDIWLLQYNSLGELTSAAGVDKRQHLRVGEDGVVEVSDLQVTLQASDDCTIFLIANLGGAPLDNNEIWPDNLEAFKKLTIPVDFMSVPSGDAEDGHVNKIGLFGYYKGAVQSGMTMNISLSRLITRLRLDIKPSYEMTGTVELKLENVRSRINIFPTQTPYQAEGATEEEKAADRAANFTTFTKTIPNLDAGGIVQYFYAGENMNPSVENATKLTVTNNGKVYTTLLGAESPEAGEPSSRNLTLERNSGYNFDINLKVLHYVEKDIERIDWDASGGQGVSNARNIINNSADNEFTTIWKSSLGTFLKIDMKKEIKFNIFKLYQNNYSTAYKVYNITLQGSHDNTNFEDIITTNIPISNAEQSFRLPEAVEYRYLRLIFNRWVVDGTQGSVYLSQFNLAYYGYEY